MHAALTLSTVSRSRGRSAVAAAAYRAGDKLRDDRYDKTHDYSRKGNVEHDEIITPAGAPEWASNREQLWNQVEASEKRKDAQLAKEVILTLPRELTAEQQKQIVRDFAQDAFISRGLVADVALHNPDASDGGKNPHAHILVTLREIGPEGFGRKQTGYENGGLDSKETLRGWRELYESHLNRYFESSGGELHADLRSLKERGINRVPQPKMGPTVAAMERKGVVTERGRQVRRSQHMQPAPQSPFVRDLGRLVNDAHEDIARTYYATMYGEDHAREMEHGYER